VAMGVNFDAKIPIYIQIMDLIKRDIITNKLKSGDKIPSVREMAVELQVNPNTLQRAYQELEREGITYTQRGMGTFVKEDTSIVDSLKREMAKEIINNFIDGMKELGFNNEEILKIVKDKIKEEV
jgi:DNA-binding transcriptional regulator YhcF (GntR family)